MHIFFVNNVVVLLFSLSLIEKPFMHLNLTNFMQNLDSKEMKNPFFVS